MGVFCMAAVCWFPGCNWPAWFRLEGVRVDVYAHTNRAHICMHAVCSYMSYFGPEEGRGSWDALISTIMPQRQGRNTSNKQTKSAKSLASLLLRISFFSIEDMLYNFKHAFRKSSFVCFHMTLMNKATWQVYRLSKLYPITIVTIPLSINRDQELEIQHT